MNRAAESVKAAAEAWAGAPVFVRAQAGPFVAPILAALDALAGELAELRAKLEGGAK